MVELPRPPPAARTGEILFKEISVLVEKSLLYSDTVKEAVCEARTEVDTVTILVSESHSLSVAVASSRITLVIIFTVIILIVSFRAILVVTLVVSSSVVTLVISLIVRRSGLLPALQGHLLPVPRVVVHVVAVEEPVGQQDGAARPAGRNCRDQLVLLLRSAKGSGNRKPCRSCVEMKRVR